MISSFFIVVFIQDDDTTCSLALSSQGSNTDLDPLADSLEVEFGYDITDAGARRSNMTGQSQRLHRQVQPSPLATTSARAPAQSSRGALGKEGQAYQASSSRPFPYFFSCQCTSLKRSGDEATKSNISRLDLPSTGCKQFLQCVPFPFGTDASLKWLNCDTL